MPFAPTDLTGLAAWYRPDLGLFQDSGGTTPATADTDPVGLWQDQSGSGWHLTAPSGAPTLTANSFNGLPGVNFTATGTAYLRNATFNALNGSAGATVFAVGYARNYPGTLLGTGAGLQTEIIYFDSDWSWATTGSYCPAKVLEPSGEVKVVATRFDGSQTGDADRLRMWAGGIAMAPAFVGNPIVASLGSTAGLELGRQYGAGSYLEGPILEVILYSRALTDGEVDQVHAYLAARYGAGLLPRIWFGGDSLTWGYGAVGVSLPTYPEHMATHLGGSWLVENGRSPNTAEVGARAARIDVLAANADRARQFWRPQEWYVLWGGINDFNDGGVGNPIRAAADVFADLLANATARRDLGYRVGILTATARSDSGTAGDFAARRATLNSLIRAEASPPWEFVCDLDGTVVETAGADNDATYSVGDGVHLSSAGYEVVADAVYAALSPLISGGGGGTPATSGPLLPEGRLTMIKNAAGQKLVVFAYQVSGGLIVPVTGDAANLTAHVSKDYGTPAALADASAAELSATAARGFYVFDLAQAETDAAVLVFSAGSTTSGVEAIAVPAVVETETVLAAVPADVTSWAGVTVGAANLAALSRGTANAGGSGTSFTATIAGSTLSATTGAFDGQKLLFQSGALAGEAGTINTYVVSSGTATFTFVSGQGFTGAPAAGDSFVIG